MCAYDVPLICSSMFDRMQVFGYGWPDKSNKPPIITSFSVDMLSFDASQMWCLTRMLYLAICDLIFEDSQIWQFSLGLRDLPDLILAPCLSDADVVG